MSKIEVNTVEPQCGTTLTLGGSGDTVALGTGASQTGFGRTGTVDWDTTPKTATFTAENGKGYFCNTTAGTFELDLPAGSAGAIVSLQDYNNTFDTYNLTVDPNGSEKINGGDAGETITLSTEGLGITFVYIDSTVGWRSVQSNEYATAGQTPAWVAATGGNTTITCGDYKTHIFTGPGTLCVSCAGNPGGSDKVDYLVVAGGGASGIFGGPNGGGYQGGGGAGGGGFRSYSALPSASPLNAPAGLPVPAAPYPVTVGGGGAAVSPNNCTGTVGDASIFSSITSAGGGGGGSKNSPCNGSGGSGGSGGGGTGRRSCQSVSSGGAGNTPPVSPPQGNDGSVGGQNPPNQVGAGGGGGAGAAAVDMSPLAEASGTSGGAGSYVADAFFGPTAPSYGQSPTPLAPNGRYFAGGGAGGSGNLAIPATHGLGGAGGGGYGGCGAVDNSGANGAVNTGGGGGGPSSQPGTAGGSGIVVIRYKFQN
jgi:hypothetical protein